MPHATAAAPSGGMRPTVDPAEAFCPGREKHLCKGVFWGSAARKLDSYGGGDYLGRSGVGALSERRLHASAGGFGCQGG